MPRHSNHLPPAGADDEITLADFLDEPFAKLRKVASGDTEAHRPASPSWEERTGVLDLQIHIMQPRV